MSNMTDGFWFQRLRLDWRSEVPRSLRGRLILVGTQERELFLQTASSTARASFLRFEFGPRPKSRVGSPCDSSRDRLRHMRLGFSTQSPPIPVPFKEKRCRRITGEPYMMLDLSHSQRDVQAFEEWLSASALVHFFEVQPRCFLFSRSLSHGPRARELKSRAARRIGES